MPAEIVNQGLSNVRIIGNRQRFDRCQLTGYEQRKSRVGPADVARQNPAWKLNHQCPRTATPDLAIRRR